MISEVLNSSPEASGIVGIFNNPVAVKIQTTDYEGSRAVLLDTQLNDVYVDNTDTNTRIDEILGKSVPTKKSMFDKIKEWVVSNPMYAIAIGVGAVLLFTRKGKNWVKNLMR
ncbi:MAG: hypothetical protein FADNKDHG_01467 [Holosporales bacterium]